MVLVASGTYIYEIGKARKPKASKERVDVADPIARNGHQNATGIGTFEDDDAKDEERDGIEGGSVDRSNIEGSEAEITYDAEDEVQRDIV